MCSETRWTSQEQRLRKRGTLRIVERALDHGRECSENRPIRACTSCAFRIASLLERLPLGGGKLLSEITNRIVAFTREHYGRGPIKAKTYVLDNLIVCVLANGFTAIERTMMSGGEQTACSRCAATSSV